MIDIEELKKLVSSSHSLDDDEKNSLIKIAPYLKDADQEKLLGVLKIEQEVLRSFPEIKKGLNSGLQEAFEHTYRQYVAYKKDKLKHSEEHLRKKEMQDAEQQLNDLNQP